MSIRDNALLQLLFPPVCPACGQLMHGYASVICADCHLEIPLTGYYSADGNPLAGRLRDHLPVERASAMLFYTGAGRFRHLVHSFKYGGAWRGALEMGRWYGSLLEQGGLYGGIDAVCPVPLHPLRRIGRGYNQSEYLARGIGMALGKPIDTRSLVRHTNNPHQARSRAAAERWENVEGIFSVRRPEAFAGRHVLLVDDVLTTGATVLACAGTILKACPDARVSIAALAATARWTNKKT